MSKVSTVEIIKPPMTTVANGRCTSAPAEVAIAIGRIPEMQPVLSGIQDGVSVESLF